MIRVLLPVLIRARPVISCRIVLKLFVVHGTFHLSANASGIVTVNFNKMSMSCAG